MPANALVQTRVDAAIKERAAQVLEGMGLTVSDAVRMLLTRTANEGALPFPMVGDPAAHDAWFRIQVQQALDDLRPTVAHRQVEAEFSRRRSAAAKKSARPRK